MELGQNVAGLLDYKVVGKKKRKEENDCLYVTAMDLPMATTTQDRVRCFPLAALWACCTKIYIFCYMHLYFMT